VTKNSSMTQNRARRETSPVATGVAPAVHYMAAKKLHLGAIQVGRTVVRLARVGVAELKVALLRFDPDMKAFVIRRTNTLKVLPIFWLLLGIDEWDLYLRRGIRTCRSSASLVLVLVLAVAVVAGRG
jgi:hypothetical protein